MMHTAVPDVNEQLRHAAARFERHFGRRPRFAAAAPGRVNLIGEHTDYNDGFVLPMALERRTVIVADRVRVSEPARRVRAVSEDEGQPAEFTADRSLAPGEPKWANYIRGVVAGFLERGLEPGGFDAVVSTTVPVGGGLSSSAALEVSAATLLEALLGHTLAPVDKALLCQKAEHVFAGTPCGIMDQSISVMAQAGHAMMMDCRSLATTMVPLNDPGVEVLIANTNVKHELSGGEYAQRRAQCEAAARKLEVPALRDVSLQMLEQRKGKLDAEEYRRAHHVVTEIARTQRAAEAATAGDWPAFGRLMFESHASLRDDFVVSCPELDIMVDLARERSPGGGVFGSRMTGGGFGGCTVSLVRSDAVEAVTRHLYEGYKAKTGIEPMIFATRAGEGARIMAVE